MPSVTRVLHTATWDHFTSELPERFSRSPQVVKDAIMSDTNNLVQEFRGTSSDIGASLFAMRRLLGILQKCFYVCFDIICLFATANDFADKNLQLAKPRRRGENYWYPFVQSGLLDLIKAKWRNRRAKIQLDAYRKMSDQSFSKSKDLGDMLRLLPGVVVQKELSKRGMAHLYRIKPDLLDRFIKSTTFEPLEQISHSNYMLDDYLSGFLQDRDRSQLYYCDPMLQHISICRHLFSLMDPSRFNAFDLE